MNVTERTEIREVVTTEEVKAGVTIELTNEEASDLCCILRHIGGDPVTTPRRVASAILDGFREFRVEPNPCNPAQGMRFRSSWEPV